MCSLIERRLNRGLTLREAATRIGVTHPTLFNAENGGRPHPSNAKKIADFYGLKVMDLFPVEEKTA